MALLATLGAAGLRAQGHPAPPAEADLVADLQAFLQHGEPLVRGEAALALAPTHRLEYHAPILKVARDPHPAARLRGILALGMLGMPGAESFLGETFLDAHRSSIEHTVAALGLGLLPDDMTAPAIDTFFRQARTGSYRRHQDTLAALLFGYTRVAHASRTAPLRYILEDEANKYPELRRLAIASLARVPGSLVAADVERLLRSGTDTEQIGILDAMRPHGLRPDPRQEKLIERLARRDRNPAVRAAALRLLARLRQPIAIELGARALRSSNPDEVTAGVKAVLHLGGGAMRRAMEDRILSTRRPEIKETMLRAQDSGGSKEFIERCLRLAADPRTDLGVRVYAATLAASSGDPRALLPLRHLFSIAEDLPHLTALAKALVRMDPDSVLPEGPFPPSSTNDIRLLPARLHALIEARHPRALGLMHQALQSAALAAKTKAGLIHALRLAQAPKFDPFLLGILPERVADLLR